MLNYIKFAIFQVINFSLIVFHIKELKKEPHNIKVTHRFLYNHAKKSLRLVNINVNVRRNGKNTKRTCFVYI